MLTDLNGWPYRSIVAVRLRKPAKFCAGGPFGKALRAFKGVAGIFLHNGISRHTTAHIGQHVLGTALGSGSAWTTAGATLAAAIAFRPLRARLQDAVDRRFNRARYDALRRVQDFLEDLRAGRAAPEDTEGLLRELVGDPQLELRFLLSEGDQYVDARGMPIANLDATPFAGAQ